MVVTNEDVGDRAVRFAAQYGWVTADILHDLPFEEHQDKRMIGAVLAGLEKKGVLYPDHYVASKRHKCHKRPIMLYRLRSAA